MATANSKSFDILRVSTKNQSEFESLRLEIDGLKSWAQGKTAKKIESDKDLLLFLVDHLKKDVTGLTRNETSKGKIVELIKKQLEINKNNNESINLGKTIVLYNKRRITPSWVQSELGCSFNPVKEWFDNEANAAMLEKHHAACKIDVNHNRLVTKALKIVAKMPNSSDAEVD
jgi:hypothetical protein